MDNRTFTSLFTIGHGTLDEEAFATLLSDANVELLVDVRTAPGSRHNPQFARERMEVWVPQHGVAYRWERRLGGFRKADPDSDNTGLRHSAFRGYADHMATAEFKNAFAQLMDEAQQRRTAVMCSESVWWRCHRRLIADAATLLADAGVVHLMHDGSRRPHQLTEGAERQNDRVRYAPPSTAHQGGNPQ
jgi:uncharacterized protein (DUF488 family)